MNTATQEHLAQVIPFEASRDKLRAPSRTALIVRSIGRNALDVYASFTKQERTATTGQQESMAGIKTLAGALALSATLVGGSIGLEALGSHQRQNMPTTEDEVHLYISSTQEDPLLKTKSGLDISAPNLAQD